FHSDMYLRYKPLLLKLFASKCAYCESNISRVAAGEVEQFRPKSKYWWLAYEWQNLLLACPACNRYKADRFPVEGVQAKTPEDDVNREQRLLIDPTVDSPDADLVFSMEQDAVIASGLTRRGRTTIELLGLNRPDLAIA